MNLNIDPRVLHLKTFLNLLLKYQVCVSMYTTQKTQHKKQNNTKQCHSSGVFKWSKKTLVHRLVWRLYDDGWKPNQFVDSLNHYYHFLPNLFKVNVAILLFFTLNFVLINAYLKDGELKLIGANNKFSNVLGC